MLIFVRSLHRLFVRHSVVHLFYPACSKRQAMMVRKFVCWSLVCPLNVNLLLTTLFCCLLLLLTIWLDELTAALGKNTDCWCWPARRLPFKRLKQGWLDWVVVRLLLSGKVRLCLRWDQDWNFVREQQQRPQQQHDGCYLFRPRPVLRDCAWLWSSYLLSLLLLFWRLEEERGCCCCCCWAKVASAATIGVTGLDRKMNEDLNFVLPKKLLML